MTDGELLLTVEARKKSGWIAALLNLFIPGSGYFYCGNWLLGIAALGLIALLFWGWGHLALIFVGGLQLMFVIDGFLCASRYNKRLIVRVLNEERLANASIRAA